MPAARITIDGLWRCLCPSIDAVALNRALSVRYRPQQTSIRAAADRKTRAGAAHATKPRRRLHTTSRQSRDELGGKEKEDALPSVNANDAVTTGGELEQDAASGPNPSGGEKLAEGQSEQAPQATNPNENDFKEKPLNTGDQRTAEAWKGYVDVVYPEGDTKRRPPGQAGRDPLNDIYAPEQEAEEDHAPATRQLGQGVSSTAAGANTGKDPFEAMLDAYKTPEKSISALNNVGEDSPPEVEDAHAGKNAFAVTGAANAGSRNGFPPTVQDAASKQDSSDQAAHSTASKGSESLGSNADKTRQYGSPETVNKSGSRVPDAGSADSMPHTPTKEEASPKVEQGANSLHRTSTRLPQNKEHGLATDMAALLVNLKDPYTIPPEADKDSIYSALIYMRMDGQKRSRKLTAALLKHLLAMSDTRPNPFVYDTLFRAHALPEGSVDVVTSLLKEMRERRVPWSSAAYHSVLRVLAVHPDYLLRNDIIREMKERWLDILPRGHRYIAVGLLRDEQYELALDKLDYMVSQGIEVQPWVFDIYIYVFGRLEMLDEALRIAHYRVNHGLEVALNIWYFLLDVCSKGQHHEGTTYIWNRTVPQGVLNPSDGTCLNILNMAAVHGDTELATQVIQYLAERGTRLARPHYEALADAYCMQGNVERAIEVYCIMYGAGAEVNQASAGTLSQGLSKDPSLIDKAVEAMTELKTKYKLPIGVYNSVLLEMVKSSAASTDESYLKGLDLYRRIKDFVPSGPNWDTFRILLRSCTRPDIAQFLAGEMIAFGIRQDLALTELLFKVHVENQGPLHRTKKYFYKISPHLHSSYRAGSRRWQNIMDLSVQLVKQLIAAGDPEAWRILEICRRNGLEQSKIAALQKQFEAGELTVADDPLLPDVPEGDWPGLDYPKTTDLLR